MDYIKKPKRPAGCSLKADAKPSFFVGGFRRTVGGFRRTVGGRSPRGSPNGFIYFCDIYKISNGLKPARGTF